MPTVIEVRWQTKSKRSAHAYPEGHHDFPKIARCRNCNLDPPLVRLSVYRAIEVNLQAFSSRLSGRSEPLRANQYALLCTNVTQQSIKFFNGLHIHRRFIIFAINNNFDVVLSDLLTH